MSALGTSARQPQDRRSNPRLTSEANYQGTQDLALKGRGRPRRHHHRPHSRPQPGAHHSIRWCDNDRAHARYLNTRRTHHSLHRHRAEGLEGQCDANRHCVRTKGSKRQSGHHSHSRNVHTTRQRQSPTTSIHQHRRHFLGSVEPRTVGNPPASKRSAYSTRS